MAASPTMNLNRPYHESLSFTEEEPGPVVFYAPSHRDFLFPQGAAIRLGLLSQKRAVSATWKLLPNMGTAELASGEGDPEPDGGFWLNIPAADLRPGFYDCSVEVNFGGRTQKFLTTFGVAIDRIPPPPAPPADFQTFWQSVREEVGRVALNAQAGPWQRFGSSALESYLTLQGFLPKRFDPAGARFADVDVQSVSFDALNGYRLHAQVAKPPLEGRLPAILVLPGAGEWNAVRPFPLEHARHGYLAMDVSIHGVGTPAGPSGEPRRDHKDFQMVANALQALRYLKSRADVDPMRIAVVGMSQGGRLALVLSSLDPDIRATAASIVHHADLGLNFRLGLQKEAPSSTSAYYDVVSFASNVRCPAFVSAGLVDRVSPATSVHQAFLAVASSEKVFVPMPGIAHFVTFEADRLAWRWLEKFNPPQH